jgi:hypothetical protein
MERIHLSDPFADSKEKTTRKCATAGRHVEAYKLLKNKRDPTKKKLWVPKNKTNRKKSQRANIVTKYFNNKMKSRLEKNREVYYKDAVGIELNYPIGAELRNLAELKIAHNDKEDNNFNVYIGCERGEKKESTFVVLKVSQKKKKIAPEKMAEYNEALEGLLKNKNSVIRGTSRKGVTAHYVCAGYRKNPENKEISQYTYKLGVDEATKTRYNTIINNLVGELESRCNAEMGAANLHNCAGCDAFVKAQEEFGLPAMNIKGRATQLAVSKKYSSPNHTDADYYYTYLSVHDEEAEPDEVLYHFCFPTYGIAVPMTKGDIIVFNPLVDHCATNPRRETTLIYSAYVSNKTCKTVVANAVDDQEN